MISFTTGNLLETGSEALVNTVNTVGVMGKGIALMFKEAFPDNFKAYKWACDAEQVHVGQMFVTDRSTFLSPRWIINFPTKQHWRGKTRVEWIDKGLADLRRVIIEKEIKSIAIPPLGCGNGGLDWDVVRPRIEAALSGLGDVEIIVFEPTTRYQNVAKRRGVQKLTPARALVAESVRRYWILGIECTVLEVQKLAWFLSRNLEAYGPDDPLELDYQPDRYGPYADNLRHLLNAMDGSYLHCSKRLADAGPMDTIWFDDDKRNRVHAYLHSESKAYIPALDATSALIDGFESPLGMELLSTVDWLITREDCTSEVESIRSGFANWPGGDKSAAERKTRIFDDRLIELALDRLTA